MLVEQSMAAEPRDKVLVEQWVPAEPGDYC